MKVSNYMPTINDPVEYAALLDLVCSDNPLTRDDIKYLTDVYDRNSGVPLNNAVEWIFCDVYSRHGSDPAFFAAFDNPTENLQALDIIKELSDLAFPYSQPGTEYLNNACELSFNPNVFPGFRFMLMRMTTDIMANREDYASFRNQIVKMAAAIKQINKDDFVWYTYMLNVVKVQIRGGTVTTDG